MFCEKLVSLSASGPQLGFIIENNGPTILGQKTPKPHIDLNAETLVSYPKIRSTWLMTPHPKL